MDYSKASESEATASDRLGSLLKVDIKHDEVIEIYSKWAPSYQKVSSAAFFKYPKTIVIINLAYVSRQPLNRLIKHAQLMT